MSGSFAFRQLWIYRISAAAVLALALSACGGGGNGGPVAELAAAPASKGGAGAASADGDSAAAGAPPRAGAGGGGSLPVEERLSVEPGAEEAEPGVPVGEGPGEGGGSAPGGGSTSPSAAVWHVFGEAGTGPNGAALVTAEDLAGISTTSLVEASDGRPNMIRFDPAALWKRLPPTLTHSDAWGARSYRASMTVRVGHNDGGQVTYGLTYRENEDFTRDPDDPEGRIHHSGILWELDSETAGANVRRLSSGGRQGALFRRETDAGSLWAAIATDISGPGDTDWLATGVWAYAPAGGPRAPSEGQDDSRGYHFGVFATGGDPFPGPVNGFRRCCRTGGGAAMAALTGTATYEGDAAGFARRAGRNDLFSADATLAIDFSDNSDAGSAAATGRIHNMEIDGAPIAGNPEIILSPSRLIGDAYGVIGGEGASMTFDGAPWNGNWGAALFGTPAPGATGADRLPGSVAGTFGVVRYGYGQSRWKEAFIGAFGAHRTAWTDSPEGVRPPCPPRSDIHSPPC